jgi:hypothetical protein
MILLKNPAANLLKPAPDFLPVLRWIIVGHHEDSPIGRTLPAVVIGGEPGSHHVF